MEESSKVWAPHLTDGFRLGKIVDLGGETITVQPFDDSQPIVAPYDSVFPAEEDPKKDVDDNCALMFLNEATLLNNIRLRYIRDQIYTYVANILIAVNPYFEIKNLYSSASIQNYQGKSLGVLPPHVFAIGDKAFRDMRALKKSQSVIVSGESGAGKTESTKYILRYLCESWGSHAGPIEQRILDANPVLEAFGNAKTMRNNNSSRFGKFIEIHFSNKYSVVGGYISHYLLEKSRICGQNSAERNYHIFYQLCAGAPDPIFQKLKLGPPDQFAYLKEGCTQYFNGSKQGPNQNRLSQAHREDGPLRDSLLDDAKDFATLDQALNRIGLEEASRLAIYGLVAAVLHLGNIQFVDNPDDTRGGCEVDPDTEGSLATAALLMGVSDSDLRQCLLTRVMQTSKGGAKGTIYMVPLKVHEAQHARDALAKAMYARLFDYIVQTINHSIPFSSSSYYIGVLDIAGFEYFQNNSFEQFCINYCNEKLQQFFNERILKEEQALYEKEGLNVRKIKYIDNQDCIELLEGKGQGIFDLLDEESKLPRASPVHFTSTVHSQNGRHLRLAVPRKSKIRDHRELRDDEGFLIRHFAGAVCYETAKFIEKNNDALHASLESLMLESGNQLLKELFAKKKGSSPKNSSVKSQQGKLTFESVGSKFRTQLQDLMTKLRSTGTHFVRCIKPNFKMTHHHFEGGQILSQLRCSGMTSVLELMQQGYPSRAQFSDLYSMYKSHLPPELARLDPRLFCKALFKALGLNENDFCFGLTKVFFRPGKFAEFDQLLRSDPAHLAALVTKVRKWLLGSRWKKAQWCALSVIKLRNKITFRRESLITIQKYARMYLARLKYRPRYQGLARLKKLQSQFQQLRPVCDQLRSQKQEMQAQISGLEARISQLISQLRVGPPKDGPAALDKEITNLARSLDTLLSRLQQLVAKQEELRRIEEEREAERKRKEAEEKQRREEEEVRRRKAEMEEQRRKEEEAFLLAQCSKKEAVTQTFPTEQEESIREQMWEQEHRDHELALRLAQDMNGTVEEVCTPPPLPRSQYIRQQQQELANRKFDLSKWKYSELRDTINTSCDIELLQACKDEFHRRLKVYHSWKSKNTARKADSARQHTPQSILDSAAQSSHIPQLTQPTGPQPQRYFRIPFLKTGQTSQKGWWYAHFDGQWIARQIELHPNKTPLLLVAGRDDLHMCELSLEETGLARKRGAEILESEFEEEWAKHNGPAYVKGATPRTAIAH